MEKPVNDFEDLAELFTKETSDNGVWVPVELYKKNLNLQVLVYGNDSDCVQNYTKKKMQDKLKMLNVTRNRGGGISFNEEGLEEALDDGIDDCLIRIGGLSRLNGDPLKLNGKEVPMEKNDNSKEIYAGILRGMPELKDFVISVSNQRTYFLPKRKEN